LPWLLGWKKFLGENLITGKTVTLKKVSEMVKEAKENKVKKIPLLAFKNKLANGLVVATQDMHKGETIGYIVSGDFYYYTNMIKFKKE
jgi:hypothetical protein